jgi:phosphoribosyl 1,2-cyclic phosphodiesterase
MLPAILLAAALLSLAVSSAVTEEIQLRVKTKLDELTFLGTGPSYQLPWVACSPVCPTCLSGLSSPYSADRRRNTSVFLKTKLGESVLVDCGKSFYSGFTELLMPRGIATIDRVLLTHPHADAINGLDDLRAFTDATQKTITVHADQPTIREIENRYPYMRGQDIGGSGKLPKFSFVEFETNKVVAGIKDFEVMAVEVEHGKKGDGPFMSNGFLFDGVIAYLSDVSKVPDQTMQLLMQEGKIEVLIIDCDTISKKTTAHLKLEDALAIHYKIKPKQLTLLTGMSHGLAHDELNGVLPEKVRAARDGMVLKFIS